MPGHLEVIYGCMFSGKSEVLIGRMHRAKIVGAITVGFKPAIDNRYEGNQKVNSHSGLSFDAIPVKCAGDIPMHLTDDTEVVGIDEAQFFDQEIIRVCQAMVAGGIRVIVAGLSLDFRGEPFGSMPELIVLAHEALHLKAICVKCDKAHLPQTAIRTQRLVNGSPALYTDPLVVIGANESYEARCLHHHEVPGKPL